MQLILFNCYSATVSATDPDGDTVSYSETGGTVLSTAGLSLNSATGAIQDTCDQLSTQWYRHHYL
jgi:hypothetical protein